MEGSHFLNVYKLYVDCLTRSLIPGQSGWIYMGIGEYVGRPGINFDGSVKLK